MNKEKKGFFSKLRDKYRINVINPENFEEISSFSATWLHLIMLLSVMFVLGFGLSLVVLLYTPVNGYLLDNSSYIESEKRVQALYQLVDSVETELNRQAQYVEPQLKILRGEDDVYAEDNSETEAQANENVDPDKLMHISPEDSALRKELENDAYGLKKKEGSGELLHFYPPVNGIVNAGFNAAINHYAVDLIADKDSPVKATLDGTVIYSEFSATTGNVIMLQHLNNYISVYKHNSVLLKSVGNFVRAGESIAIIGNSGELTSGPHLHFELWRNGQPLNPENFIVF